MGPITRRHVINLVAVSMVTAGCIRLLDRRYLVGATLLATGIGARLVAIRY
jgi:hypothetical protein